jgi:hypothetical protein
MGMPGGIIYEAGGICRAERRSALGRERRLVSQRTTGRSDFWGPMDSVGVRKPEFRLALLSAVRRDRLEE